jgi:benzoate membrane transport protein
MKQKAGVDMMGLPEKQHEQIKEKHSILQELNSENISAGLISSTLVMTGPAVIILQAAASGGFTSQQTVSWMFAVIFSAGYSA